MAGNRRLRRDQATSIDLTDPAVPFCDLFVGHMEQRSGCKGREVWTDEVFANTCSVTDRSVREWASGKTLPSETSLIAIVKSFELRPDSPEERALRAAWENSAIGTTPPVFVFPVDIPADLVARRKMADRALRSLLEAGGNSKTGGALAALCDCKCDWSKDPLAEPTGGNSRFGVAWPFIRFESAVRTCNDRRPAWGDASAKATESLHTQRARDCYEIAKLLSLPIWTEDAWRRLQKLEDPRDVQHVLDPRLLQAGIDAAHNREFSLPYDPPTGRPLAPRGARTWPPTDQWFVDGSGEIRMGVGKDHHEALLHRIAALFDSRISAKAPTRRPGEDERSFHSRLRSFEEVLAAEIDVQCASGQGHSFALAEEFGEPDDPGIAELRRYAGRLATMPLPYRRSDSDWVLPDEHRLLAAIQLCLSQIALIP